MSAGNAKARLLAPSRVSLTAETVRVLKENIMTGIWHDFLPGERVLCEQLQISRPTLRTALQVLAKDGWIAVAHGHRTRLLSNAASKISQSNAVIVGMLSPEPLEMMPPFVMLWLDELRHQLAAAGHLLHVQVGKGGFARNQPEHALRTLVDSSPATVWILYQSTEAMQRWFAMNDARCIVVGSLFEGISLPSIDRDYRATCRHAVGLLSGRGHSSIALLIQEGRFGGDLESELGFQEGLAAMHRRKVRGMIMHHDGTPEKIGRCIQRLLSLRERPSALLVARSAHALTALTVLLTLGVQVPQEMALLCRDDDAFLDHVIPKMSRYTVAPAVFAKKLFRLVMHEVQEGQSKSQSQSGHVLPAFLERDSL